MPDLWAGGGESVGTMPGTMGVASANILYSLDRSEARAALDQVLDLEPDLIGLQEWSPKRVGLLSEAGRVGLAPHVGVRLPSRRSRDRLDYLWNQPLLGGCAVGARADRFELLSCRTRLLGRPGFGDRKSGRRPVEPPREATVAVYRDLRAERTVCLVNYHLVSGIQAGGRYRTDRPVLSGRHLHEVELLTRTVGRQRDLGHVVYATGDSNFDGMRIAGLTSAWEGREDWAGTLGPRRKVDDAHGPCPAESVTVLTTPSDHRAIVVRW